MAKSLWELEREAEEDKKRQNAISNAQTRIVDAGGSIPANIKARASALGGALMKGLDILDRPRNAAALGIRQVGINYLNPNATDSMKRSIYDAAKAGMTRKETFTGSDMLKDLGVENKYGRFFGGLAIDMATDPLMYGTAGLGIFAKGAITGAGTKLSAEAAEQVGKRAASNVYREAKKKALKSAGAFDVTDLARRTGKSVDDTYTDISRTAFGRYYAAAASAAPGTSSKNIYDAAKKQYGADAAKKYAKNLELKAGKGMTAFGKTIVSGAGMQNAGAAFGNKVRATVGQLPIIGNTGRAIADVSRKWFDTRQIAGVDRQTEDIFKAISNRAAGNRSRADAATSETMRDIATLQGGLKIGGRPVADVMEEIIAGNRAGLTKADLDTVITNTPDKKFAARRLAEGQMKSPGHILDPENMTLGELINLYSRQARSMAIEESREGLLKGSALNMYRGTNISGAMADGKPVTDYTARVRAVDNGFAIRGGKTRNLAVSNWFANKRKDVYEGMISKEMNEEIRKHMRDKGMKVSDKLKVMEEDALKALTARQVTSNKMLADKEYMDEILDTFGEPLYNPTPQDYAAWQSRGYTIVIPKMKYNLLSTGGDTGVKQIAETVDADTAKLILKGQSSLNALQEISSSEATNFLLKHGKGAKIYALPAGIVQKVNKNIDNQLSEGLQVMVDMADKFYSVWKPMVTGMRPQYHARNLVSASFNNFLALGTDMLSPETQRMAGAVAFVGRGSNAKIDDVARDVASMTVDIQGKTYTAKEIYDLMIKHKALNTFHLTDAQELSNAVMDAVSTKQAGGPLRQFLNSPTPAAAFRLWAGAGSSFGNSVEEYARATNFIGFMKRGFSPEAAGEMVDKYHFDYQDLTDMEKFIKGIGLPFYTWLRRNLPLQLESILNDPRPYMTIHRASQTGADVEGIEYSDIPQYLQKNMAIPLGRSEDGSRVKLWDAGLPLGDLQISLGDISAGLNPIVKMAYEVKAGRSLLTGAPIRRYDGQESVDLINRFGGKDKVNPKVQEALLSDAGITATEAGKFALNNSGVFRDIINFGFGEAKDSQIVQQARHVSGFDNEHMRSLGSYLDPNFTKYYSPELAKRSKDYDYERLLGNTIQRLKAMGYPVRTMNEIK